MPSLAVSSTASVPIQGNEVITVSSQFGTIFRVTFTPLDSQTPIFGGGRSYGPQAQNVALGPFGRPGTLVIENQTSTQGAALTFTQSGGYTQPYVLAQSAVPVILPSSGSSNATGQITLTTALPYQPSGTVGLYLPAGVVTAGSQGTGAAVYQVIFSSTSVCQIQGTGIVTANGAYTQTTAADLTLVAATVPGGAMGANGALRIFSQSTVNNSAGTKTPKIFHGSQLLATTSLTTVTGATLLWLTRNRGAQNLQTFIVPIQSANNGSQYATIDTSVNQLVTFTGQLAAATDYIILENYLVEVLPGI